MEKIKKFAEELSKRIGRNMYLACEITSQGDIDFNNGLFAAQKHIQDMIRELEEDKND